MKYFLPLVGYLLITLPGWTQRDCHSVDYQQQQLKADPSLAARLEEVEQFTRLQLRKASVTVNGQGPKENIPAVITIPVVVHIVYNSSAQNISDAQVLSQLDVLNADYGKHNADTSLIPGSYARLAADCGFRFVLAGIDTNGSPTTGIIRKHTIASGFTLDDAVKFSQRGGDDAWDRDRYLNIWVCDLTGGKLGYSSFAGSSRQTDGVVIRYTAWGTNGTARAPYNRGRTATHEIGHWMNLIHIWGDTDCGDDEVADTPPQQSATTGDPNGVIVSCGNAPLGNLYMDYMDFTDDIGMHLFTNGQRDRMRALFAVGGFRNPLLSSRAGAVSAIGSGQTSTGASGSSMPAVECYPNPAINMVTVNVRDNALLGTLLELYNQIGMKVMAVPVTHTSFQLNLSGLPGGVYFVRLDAKNTFKVVKL